MTDSYFFEGQDGQFRDAAGNIRQRNEGDDYFDDVDEVVYTAGMNARGEAVQIPSASHHSDGTRTWRYVPEADPNEWSAEYVDQNIAQVMTLGWVEANAPGVQWTHGEAAQAHEQWVAQVLQAHRPDENALLDNQVELDMSQYGSASSGVPVAPPAPAGGIPPAPPAPGDWQRPDDRVEGGTGYDNVMDELRQRVPENDGRWTASQAAGIYGDEDFRDEQGLAAADQRAYDAAQAAGAAADGSMSAEGYQAMNDANADVAAAYAQTDNTRNRYQQSTDYQPRTPLDQQLADIEEGRRSNQEQAEADPASVGIGVTSEQQIERARATEYRLASGQDIDVNVALNDEQRAWLDQYNASQQVRSDEDYQQWQASPAGQEQLERDRRQGERSATQAERAEESRRAAEERMGRNG